jgi:predicted transcriptional regulator
MGIYSIEKHTFYLPKFPLTIDEISRKNLESVSNLEIENKRRDRLFIMAEILTIAKDGSLKTQIMYRANLSFAQLNEYLNILTKMNLLEIQNENNKKIYKTTAKGNKYLEKYKEISDILGKEE